VTKDSSKDNIVVGIQGVNSILTNSPHKVNHVALLLNSKNPKLYELQKLASKHRIRIHQLPMSKLDSWYRGSHQGVIAFLNARPLDEWSEVKAGLLEKIANQLKPMVVLLSAIEDPHNFGACIRSAVGFGADAIICPNKGTCGLTPTAAKSSAGSSELIPVCQLPNIDTELQELKTAGFKVYGLDMDTQFMLPEGKLETPCIVVAGGEDRGIPPHIGRACDKFFKIPINSACHSFNASVALSLGLYELSRQENFSRIS